MERIYLDHHSTTPLDARVLEAMMPYLTGRFGNAASQHAFGWEAEEAVNIARRQAAQAIGAQEREIIFTSGATEANNLALKGVAGVYSVKGKHIITSATEHSCVLGTCRRLEKEGYRVTYLPVSRHGNVDLSEIEKAITAETILISVMLANNEIGTINDIKSIGEIARRRGILLHSDCSQAFGKIALDVQSMNIDLASFSAHKCYGPKGVGALFVCKSKPRVNLACQIDGGGQESGMRSGTLNVPGIVGMGMAMQVAVEEFDTRFRHVIELRNDLYHRLQNGLYVIGLNGTPIDEPDFNSGISALDLSKQLKRLPDNLNIHFGSIDGNALISGLSDIAVSTGSACSSASGEPSHVLKAIGLDQSLCRSSLRMGIGKDNTPEEIQRVAERMIDVVRDLRAKKAGVISSGQTACCIHPESDDPLDQCCS
jgi:cysteine desulfurase